MLRLACSDLTGYCPFYVARELGLWAGVEVEIKRVPSHERDRMFAEGTVDLKTTSLHSFVAKPDSGRVVAVLSAVRHPPGIDKVVLGPACTDLQLLGGARIVYLPGALEHFYLYYFLRHLGAPWPPAERRIEVNDRRAMLDLFRRGEADACITYGEGLALVGKPPNRVVQDLPYDSPVFLTTLVASAAALASQRASLARMLEGYFEAVEAVEGRLGESMQQQARSAVLRHYQGPWARIEEDLAGYLMLPRGESASVLRGSTDPSLTQRIADCAQIWQELGVIGALPDPPALVEDVLSDPKQSDWSEQRTGL
jgi:ABC-type nitrate/sulfonate/bicarbonate transport system substrate-binding protein